MFSCAYSWFIGVAFGRRAVLILGLPIYLFLYRLEFMLSLYFMLIVVKLKSFIVFFLELKEFGCKFIDIPLTTPWAAEFAPADSSISCLMLFSGFEILKCGLVPMFLVDFG